MSDPQPDGSLHALTCIAFIGSVFSPYYAWARRRGGDAGAAAEGHCAINLSLYHRPPGATRFRRRWAMTERGAADLQRDAATLRVGPSRLAWAADGSLVIDIDEWTAPWPQRLRGRLHLSPGALPGRAFALDAAGHHLWQPVSPGARLSAEFEHPALRWAGAAYLDANHGSRPLARDFRSWQWQRASLPGGGARVYYDVQALDGDERRLALGIDAAGGICPLAPPPRQPLPDTWWGMKRTGSGQPPAGLLATLDSGPFYCRSLLHTAATGDDGPTLAMHESLSLQRFDQAWVQALLPFRMPRRAAAPAGPGGSGRAGWTGGAA